MPLPEACVPHAEGSGSALGPMSVGHFGEIAGHFGGKASDATIRHKGKPINHIYNKYIGKYHP